MKRFFNAPSIVLLLVLLAIGPVKEFAVGGFPALLDWISGAVLLLPAIVIGVSVHEFAHAKVADMAGDDTPRRMGRVTLNPVAHMDPMGFISLLLIGFGWGKPVIINPYNFRNKRRDSIAVGLAGVTANLITAFVFGGLVFLLVNSGFALFGYSSAVKIGHMLVKVVIINITLMLFNLLPVPPLDGFGVLTDIFKLEDTSFYRTVSQSGMSILLILIIMGVPSKILVRPLIGIVDFILGGVYGIKGWVSFL